MISGALERGARISRDGLYRYSLTRRWGPRPDTVVWIMLNPSTADAQEDDPTIRRCMKFTQRLGYEAMIVENLFAYRATDPDKLVEIGGGYTAIGPENASQVAQSCVAGKILIAAWGTLHKKLRQGARTVIVPLREKGLKFSCLGKTRDGSPRHPLYVKGDAPLVAWP